MMSVIMLSDMYKPVLLDNCMLSDCMLGVIMLSDCVTVLQARLHMSGSL